MVVTELANFSWGKLRGVFLLNDNILLVLSKHTDDNMQAQ